jgi:sodium-dependent phosphate transporter
MAVLAPEYTWIFAITVVFAFIAAFGIGSNDMANSFGTTVGTKALTIGQVVVVAAICEFGGAVLLGAGVTSTIKSGVARIERFTASPELLMFGFMCVVIAAAFWDNFATSIGLPVSTTHTTVGATVGMTLALRGKGAVIWSMHKDEFPFISGMVAVLLSWVVSPIVAGGFTIILFLLVRHLILRRDNPVQKAMIGLPILVGGTFWLVTSFIIETGAKNKTWADRGKAFPIWVGAVCGTGIAIIFAIAIMPIIRKRVMQEQDIKDQAAADAEAAGVAPAKGGYEEKEDSWWTKNVSSKVPEGIRESKISKALFNGVNQDVHEIQKTDERVMALDANAEKFDTRTEGLFRYLQVFSACSMSFAHGANDVANAMGPLSAVYTIWQTGTVGKNSPVDTWILVLGGAGIVLGLATFGYKILRVLGVEAVKLTNARGFCAELGTAITVVIASRYGLPVSTTQCICGALLGVGLIEGVKGVNWYMFLRTFCGWLLTIVVAGFISAGLVAFGAYAPQKQGLDQVQTAAATLNSSSTAMLNMLYAANGPAANAFTTTLDGLNSTFYSTFMAKDKDVSQMANITGTILNQFNTSLAYNPFSQTAGLLVP